jgi:16S rRNA (cytosine967-C5)-methyltransferase
VEVTQRVLARRGNVSALDVRDLLPPMPALGSGPAVQLWPHRHGTDAMYIAAFRRHGDGVAPPTVGSYR